MLAGTARVRPQEEYAEVDAEPDLFTVGVCLADPDDVSLVCVHELI